MLTGLTLKITDWNTFAGMTFNWKWIMIFLITDHSTELKIL